MTDPITALLVSLAAALGIPPATAALMIPLVIIISARVARVIPDTATGPLKYVRIVCKILGIYVKDNSGVPASLAPDGTVTRKSTADDTPEVVEPEVNAVSTPNMFTGTNRNDQG